MTKLEGRVKQLSEEVDRRKFLEAKVQTYVRSLIDQNEKCKSFIRSLVASSSKDLKENEISHSLIGNRAQKFLHQLETSQFDEHDGQSTESEAENNQEEDGEEDEDKIDNDEVQVVGDRDDDEVEDGDVAISDI